MFQGSVYIAGGLKLVGGFLTAVKHPDGTTRAAQGMTSTEAVIADVGRARLMNGAAHVDLEPAFAGLVQGADYDVFPAPYADSKGLYVTNRTASGFDVREQQGGASTLDFDYRVVAKRKDGDRARLARLELPAMPEKAVTLTNLPVSDDDEPQRRDSGIPTTAPPAAAPPARP